jgi:hypothetical protein
MWVEGTEFNWSSTGSAHNRIIGFPRTSGDDVPAGRSLLAGDAQNEQNALYTLIHQRHPTPSCGGHAPAAERTKHPARVSPESLAGTLFCLLAVLPEALLLEGLGDFRRYVVFVVLRKHGVGKEAPRCIENAFGDHALVPVSGGSQSPSRGGGIAGLSSPHTHHWT